MKGSLMEDWVKRIATLDVLDVIYRFVAWNRGDIDEEFPV